MTIIIILDASINGYILESTTWHDSRRARLPSGGPWTRSLAPFATARPGRIHPPFVRRSSHSVIRYSGDRGILRRASTVAVDTRFIFVKETQSYYDIICTTGGRQDASITLWAGKGRDASTPPWACTASLGSDSSTGPADPRTGPALSPRCPSSPASPCLPSVVSSDPA